MQYQGGRWGRGGQRWEGSPGTWSLTRVVLHGGLCQCDPTPVEQCKAPDSRGISGRRGSRGQARGALSTEPWRVVSLEEQPSHIWRTNVASVAQAFRSLRSSGGEQTCKRMHFPHSQGVSFGSWGVPQSPLQSGVPFLLVGEVTDSTNLAQNHALGMPAMT